VFDWIPVIGFPEVVDKLISDIQTIYENNEEETPSMIIEAYKNDSYIQIPDFVDFYIQLQYSIQQKIIEISHIQAESIRLDSKASVIQYYKELELPVLQKTVVDNRPFDELFSIWGALPVISSFVKRNGIKHTSWVETCYIILAAIKSLFLSETAAIISVSTETLNTANIDTEHLEVFFQELEIADEQVDPLLTELLRLVHSVYRREKDGMLSHLQYIIHLLNG
jgi:N-acetyltransferase B complex (NatB) non catalytic subunit